MSRFVQLHVLTNYPPSNLNRDDTGRPKTALVGDATRLRISSQSQKRAWRTSDIFTTALAGHVGTRTKRMGREVFDALKKAGSAEKAAREWARSIAGQFGKIKSDKKTENDEDLEIEQLAHFGTEEQAAIESLVQACAARNSAPTDEELKLLRKPQQAADIAMFGRMLADNPLFNVEAAVQVSHAITCLLYTSGGNPCRTNQCADRRPAFCLACCQVRLIKRHRLLRRRHDAWGRCRPDEPR